jgi:hypothetical protein
MRLDWSSDVGADDGRQDVGSWRDKARLYPCKDAIATAVRSLNVMNISTNTNQIHDNTKIAARATPVGFRRRRHLGWLAPGVR